MAAPFFIPFNFQPESTVVHTSGNYTVSSGKYAMVTINSNTTLTSYILNSSNVPGQGLTSSQIWLSSGDIINPQNGTVLIIQNFKEIV
jgi:hypothetical protein